MPRDETSDINTHLSDETLVDLVRRVLPTDEVARIRQHLELPCRTCQKTYATWLSIAAIAAREHQYEPPENAVRTVKEMFSLKCKVSLLQRLATAARLVFDSYAEPLPAGIRGGANPARYTVHETRDFVVDISLEEEASENGCLAGQLLRKDSAQSPIRGTHVLLIKESDNLLAQTVTNSLGEFQLAFPYEGELQMYLDVPGALVMKIDIPDPAQLRTGGGVE